MTGLGPSGAEKRDPESGDRDEAALFAALIEAAPRPSVAFRARLRAELRAERAARRTTGWPAAFRQLFSVTGGLDMKRRMGMVVAVGLLAVVLAVALVPAARAEFVATWRRVALGQATEARQVEPLPGELPPGDYPWQLPEGTYWSMQTDMGNFGANVLPGESNEVRSVAGLDEAKALTGVRPLAPTELPAGYALREVGIAPGRSQMFFQFYEGDGPDILIMQTGVGIITGGEPGQSEATAVTLATDGTLETVDFDGRPAAWIDGHLLMWEADGVTFLVGGLGLDLPAALAMARSLR